MDLYKCPSCACPEGEGFECLVAFVRGQYAYLFYCEHCEFKHVIARVA